MGLFNMRMITLVYLMLASTLLAAQEKEVWACQGLLGTGYSYVNGAWVQSEFGFNNWLITVDGNDSSIKSADNGIDRHIDCEYVNDGSLAEVDIISCTSFSIETFTLNATSGAAVHTYTYGILDQKDDIIMERLNYTKF